MAVTQYIGSRYVPLFADPADWSNENAYEPLTIVLYQGNSYTSKQYVPKGIEITNADYWAQTGSYNAQVEQYRQEVQTFNGRITRAQEDAEAARTAVTAETAARQQADSALQTAVNGKAPTAHASSDSTYGVGTSNVFGHVKVSDTLADTPAADSVAASPKMVNDLNAALTSAIDTQINSIRVPVNVTLTPGANVNPVGSSLGKCSVFPKLGIMVITVYFRTDAQISAKETLLTLTGMTTNMGHDVPRIFTYVSEGVKYVLNGRFKEDGTVYSYTQIPANTTVLMQCTIDVSSWGGDYEPDYTGSNQRA